MRLRDKIVAYVGMASVFTFFAASIGLVGFVLDGATHPTDHAIRLGIVVLTAIIGAALGVTAICVSLTDEDDNEHTDI